MTDLRERPRIHVGTAGEDDVPDEGRVSARERLRARDDHPAPDDDDDDVPDARDDDDEPDARDDDELEEIAREEDAEDEAPPTAAPRPAKSGGGARTAALLLLGAGALWAAVMVLRCRPEVPPAALPEPIADASPEPADAAPRIDDEAVPEPAGTRPQQPDAEPSDAAPDEAVDDSVPTPRDDWPEGLDVPDTIRYTIRRGGSLENVANLFKIYHHEILEMNPGVGLEQRLAPDTRIVVYRRDPAVASESIGFPSGGSLAGAVPMVEGKGRRILAIPWKTWGTASTIALLDRVLDRWAARGDVQPILVGNISNRTGGKLEPHSTHQSGRDVDLGYPQKLAAGAELNWQEMNDRNLDAAETWELLKMLVDTRAVEEIYIDRTLQKLLYDYAVESGVVKKSALARWMEYPRPTGQSGTVIKHVPGHTDHLHVRFTCGKGQTRCKSR
ncbi:MAG TPA: penicillin-insensitive murein endopeptidase [Nannocystaceae bacterium]|nr:penicillin-insensitive murein endopeptidase [Nannocystaceae bacterium]